MSWVIAVAIIIADFGRVFSRQIMPAESWGIRDFSEKPLKSGTRIIESTKYTILDWNFKKKKELSVFKSSVLLRM